MGSLHSSVVMTLASSSFSTFRNLVFGMGIKGRVMKNGEKEGNESGMGTGRRTMPERVFLSEKPCRCSIGHNPAHSGTGNHFPIC